MHDAYPVAAASGRRRRMLALRSSAEFDAASLHDESDADAGFLPDWWHERQAEPRLVEPESETTLDRIRRLVDDPAPRTWLFAGDSLGCGSKHAKRGWLEHFSDVVRSHLARSLDVVLDTTTDEARCDRLLRNLDWRILRFQPDVVFLMPGSGEVGQLTFDTARLHATLSSLVERLREEGCEVVLCTLPPLQSTSDELAQRLSTMAQQVRSVADASGALLVDHVDQWSSGGDSNPASDSLLDKSGTRPTQQGHQKLARNLIRSLELPLR